MSITSRAAVLGHPIAHSLSPVLHNAAYAALGLTNWEYEAIDVESSGLADLLNATLLERDDYVGFSLTMPLKVEVLRWLDTLVQSQKSGARPDSSARVHGQLGPVATEIPQGRSDLENQGIENQGIENQGIENQGIAGGRSVIVDPMCEITGAANTLVKRPLSQTTSAERIDYSRDGGHHVSNRYARAEGVADESTGVEICAFNTDVGGIVAAIREVIRHGPVEAVAILGAGATAASALAAAVELGASEIAIFARPSTNLDPIGGVAERLGVEVSEYPLTAAPSRLATFDAVIATLPAFAADDVAAGLLGDAERGAAEQGGLLGTLLDVVYDPRPTLLQATWSALGGSVVGGERMLLHQAATQVELMTGQPAPLTAMDAALDAALNVPLPAPEV